MKLSTWAEKQGITYRTAYSWFKAGRISNARQLDNGTIIVDEESVQQIFNMLKELNMSNMCEDRSHIHKYNKGDLVIHKTGGPKMAIEHYTAIDKVVCSWFDGNKKVEEVFSEEVLIGYNLYGADIEESKRCEELELKCQTDEQRKKLAEFRAIKDDDLVWLNAKDPKQLEGAVKPRKLKKSKV